MTVIAIGLNHRSAPLSVLEKMTISADVLPKALSEIVSGEFINEAVVLSTCNRTEVYVHAERFHDAYREVRDALALVAGVDDAVFAPHLYVHFNNEGIEHLFSVAAGLDSAVLGEHEILGQIRNAWETARIEGSVGPLLGPLFEHAISSGKRVRTDTAIGRRTASISHAAVSLVRERLGDLTGMRVLLIGAGEVGSGVATALIKSEDVAVTVTNRTALRATEIAAAIGASVHSFDDLEGAVAAADVVISATGAPGQVLDADLVARACEARTAQREPSGIGADRLLILDLAVPRDVDPAVIGSDRVDLLVLSDLQAFANRGLEERQKEVVSARAVVDAEIVRYRATSSAEEVEPLLGSMHRWAEAVRSGELDHYAKHLDSLDPAQSAAVDALTRAIVKKMLHEPSVGLRSASGSHRGDRLAEAVRELFGLS